jgi:DNA (cytosine-5)-methyltransferase 1
MGYKLAGYHHLWGVEIDPKMGSVYLKNHKAKYLYIEDLREFNLREDLPKELYTLDLLDGSPPCSAFSMSGKREKDWGKPRVFKEGQKKQTLEDLVLVYCDTVIKLQPKVALMENVMGLVAWGSIKYALAVWDKLSQNGYDVQLFALNAATMGVPQARERLFFIARRKDLKLPALQLDFDNSPIYFGAIVDQNPINYKPLWKSIQLRWPYVEYGDQNLKFADARYRKLTTYNSFFSTNILYDHIVAPTLTANGATVYYNEIRNLTCTEYIRMSSFPSDYDFCGLDVRNICW